MPSANAPLAVVWELECKGRGNAALPEHTGNHKMLTAGQGLAGGLWRHQQLYETHALLLLHNPKHACVYEMVARLLPLLTTSA